MDVLGIRRRLGREGWTVPTEQDGGWMLHTREGVAVALLVREDAAGVLSASLRSHWVIAESVVGLCAAAVFPGELVDVAGFEHGRRAEITARAAGSGGGLSGGAARRRGAGGGGGARRGRAGRDSR